MLLSMLEAMRFVRLCMLEAVEGGLYLLEAPEMMRCMLLCMPEVLEVVVSVVVLVVLKVMKVVSNVLRGCAEGGGGCSEGA